MQCLNRVFYLAGPAMLVIALSGGCNEPAKISEKQAATSTPFPIADYIRSQLQEIDSLQLPVTLYRTGAEGNDTTLLSTKDCLELARPFTEPDIAKPDVASHFTESSFADQSIPSITFNYLSKEETMPLKRADVVLQPNPSVSDKVRSIYLEKAFSIGDTLVQEKLFWNDGHYYQIIRTKSAGASNPIQSTLKVVWDPTE
ncbi:hypothetical protein [Flavihumibacter sp. CACIAM 22H1]|uniref:hypothetical protein n=1 Tax=Flavihumibacter sp. CACIAM 22H1 TaxID=1812911 RepID=UPI0007A80916|nr:hypothetical protein [Flavihumibacter sp. CACIAM 22H1]KYP15290.1 MAG: hypothetical protein A1D16_11060 [Flavihumibacter sp. CACIAM 22H1]